MIHAHRGPAAGDVTGIAGAARVDVGRAFTGGGDSVVATGTAAGDGTVIDGCDSPVAGAVAGITVITAGDMGR